MYEFTYESYKDILSALTSNYNIVKYETALFRLKYEMGSAFAVIRHDVDSNLQRAIQIARIDCKMGIRSTFFLLVNSELYNLFSKNGQSFISEILEMGHNIGLHYDPLSSNSLHTEMKLIDMAVEGDVKYVSIHCMSTLSTKFTNTEDLINVSDEPFMTDIKYFADSTGEWRFGHPIDSQYFCNSKPLHINFHPVWWNKRELSDDELIEELRCDHIRTGTTYTLDNLWR